MHPIIDAIHTLSINAKHLNSDYNKIAKANSELHTANHSPENYRTYEEYEAYHEQLTNELFEALRVRANGIECIQSVIRDLQRMIDRDTARYASVTIQKMTREHYEENTF